MFQRTKSSYGLIITIKSTIGVIKIINTNAVFNILENYNPKIWYNVYVEKKKELNNSYFLMEIADGRKED